MRKLYFLLVTAFFFLAATQKSSAQYCTVTFPSNVEPITLVNFNTINNVTSATINGTPALEDFTATTTNIFKTVTYPITVKGNTDGNFTTFVNVFIDWNQDFDFDDAGENFLIGTITNSTGVDAIEVTGNILVPAGALTGNTRMRVMKRYFASGTPCNASGFGQAEDYTVNVGDLPPCVAPPGGGTTVGPAGNVCPGSNFNLSVSGGSFGIGITYQWESSTDNTIWSDIGGATLASLTTTTNVNTYYRRKITCTGSDAWSVSVLVTVTPPLALPFTETFANYAITFPPTCWARNNTTFITGQAPSAFGLGIGSVRWEFYSAPAGSILDVTTAVFTAVPANHRLTFDHAYASFSGEVDELQILYSTNSGASYSLLTSYLGGSAGPLNTIGGNTTSFFAPTAAQWASKAIALPAGTNRLIFRGNAGFGNNLFVDNIRVEETPPCLPVPLLSVTASNSIPTGSVLNWGASPSGPSSGYEWEVRSSGAPGSGATGLDDAGATAAAVLTDIANGLTPSTTYSFYVRANCGAGVFSSWTGPIVFTTPCNPIATPFAEPFTTATFPPTCWTRNNASFLYRDAASAGGVGIGSSKFDFYNASSGTNLDLATPIFTPVPVGWRLTFDHAYATFFGEVDQLQISYSTDGGATYTNLITYLGGSNGPLNTAGGVLPAFTPSAEQWRDKAVDLPIGTNRLRFRGVSAFGNNLFVDNIVVEQTPSCLPVTGVSAISTLPTRAVVSFTQPLTGPTVGYIVEYGPPNFTPGTDNNPGPGGTLAFGPPGNSVTVDGLTPGTTYDFYVRRICIAGADYSANRKATATTLCAATNIPYVQNFETSVPLIGFPTCTSMQDVNGNSGPTPNGGGGRWITNSVAQTFLSPTRSMWYIYDLGNPARGGDDWFYLQGLNLTAGLNYRVKCYYKGSDAPTWVENFEIKYGTEAINTAMTNLIYTSPTTTTNVASPWDSVIADFSVPANGIYYIGFHNISAPDQAFLFIDDISVRIAPTVDVGITGITLPSLNCPTNGVFLQATIRNYNTTTLNFATYPITVTANIAGPVSGTATAVINSGTLAPGATREIYLSPAFNFSAGGQYTITTATSSPDDPETGNDANVSTVNVNPNPATPAITPSPAAICAGVPVQLSTQFVPSPAPVVHPTVSSGTISIPIPDATAAGINHTIAVSGIPAGASVVGISVGIVASHTWNSDLIFNLRGPNGNRLNLINGRGGNGDGFNCTISSTATATLPAGNTTPVSGTFAADGASGVGPTGFTSNVTNFAGLYSVGNGNWTLAVNDNVGFDAGTLTSWTITITYQVITPTITWTPAGGLFTNVGGTTAYTAGSNAFSLYANPAATTTYTVTATTAAGCTAAATVLVTVNPIPVITVGSIPDTVCISDPLIPLAATPVGGAWTGTGVSGVNFVPPSTAVGTYTLTYSYTSPAECPATATKKIAVKDCPERIILLRDNAVILYPNPNNGQFNIRINSVLYNYLGMKVYTSTGVLVRTQMIGGLAWGRVVPIDLSNLPGGVYMVHFYYDGGVRSSEKTFKVIIGHE